MGAFGTARCSSGPSWEVQSSPSSSVDARHSSVGMVRPPGRASLSVSSVFPLQLQCPVQCSAVKQKALERPCVMKTVNQGVSAGESRASWTLNIASTHIMARSCRGMLRGAPLQGSTSGNCCAAGVGLPPSLDGRALGGSTSLLLFCGCGVAVQHSQRPPRRGLGRAGALGQ